MPIVRALSEVQRQPNHALLMLDTIDAGDGIVGVNDMPSAQLATLQHMHDVEALDREEISATFYEATKWQTTHANSEHP